MRMLEDHISPQELANLPEKPEALAAGTLVQRQLSDHLDQCEACAALVQTHWSLSRLADDLNWGNGGESCAHDQVWLELVAGLRPGESASLLSHAAGCAKCAQELRLALELGQPAQNDDTQPELQMEMLESAKPTWQSRMAKRMTAEACALRPSYSPAVHSRTVHGWRGWRNSWWPASLAATALLALAFAGIWTWRVVNPSEPHLLALAYNKQRTLPLRIPGGDPVPLSSVTRGTTHRLSEPSELARLGARAREHLEKTPNSPYWHQILGEVELLEGEDDAALSNFDFAVNSGTKLPNLLSDKAAALFQIGVNADSPQNFAQAADIYSVEIAAHSPDASLLYYNRALCWEHQNLRQNALSDLRTALSIEKSPAWREAIRSEIDRLAALSAGYTTDGYEPALEEATESLLPQWSSSPQARAEIARTARLGLRHGDRWLHEWIASPHTALTAKADQDLAAAARHGSSGEEEASLREGRQAAALYASAANPTGRARAELAEVYALQRLDRAGPCLAAAAALEREPQISSFAWIRTQLTLEEGSCGMLRGDYDRADRSFASAVSLSVEHGLDFLHLRAIGAQAVLLDFRGTPLGGWQINTDALALCARVHCPPIREYEFVYNLVHASQALGERYVAAELMRTGERLASASGDLTAHAYAVENLAVIAGRAGDYATSDSAFQEALTLARANNPILAVRLYRAECQTDRAEILLRRGAQREALSLLTSNGPALLRSAYQPGRLHYFTQLAAAQLALGDSNDALTSALAAVREGELSLPFLRSTTKKEQWQREHSPAYAQLVKVYLQRGQSEEAFTAWERSRIAPFHDLSGIPLSAIFDNRFPRPMEANRSNERVVVLARIDQSYVAWVISPVPLRVLRTTSLGSYADLSELTTTFYRLCSDPDSSLNDVKTVGARLYSLLLAPLADQLNSSATLWIEPDPSLDSIPFSALILPDGRWLDSVYQVRVLPPWWTIHPEIFSGGGSLPLSSRTLVVNAFAAAQGAEAPSDYSEASALARLFPHATLLQGDADTPRRLLKELQAAEIFHFSGHAAAQAQSNTLLLAAAGQTQSSLGADALSSLRLDRCRLAVLAACNTTASNPGRFEPASDLRNALLRSGVHTVIASQWDVDDRSTGALMLAFYRFIAQGFSPANSLQIAQQTVRSDSEWQHPYYWAAFQIFAN